MKYSILLVAFFVISNHVFAQSEAKSGFTTRHSIYGELLGHSLGAGAGYDCHFTSTDSKSGFGAGFGIGWYNYWFNNFPVHLFYTYQTRPKSAFEVGLGMPIVASNYTSTRLQPSVILQPYFGFRRMSTADNRFFFRAYYAPFRFARTNAAEASFQASFTAFSGLGFSVGYTLAQNQ
jgi:hypothetical protein